MRKLSYLLVALFVLVLITNLSAQCSSEAEAADAVQKKVEKCCDKKDDSCCKATELCTHCGEVKGSKECCKMEGKKICSKCGLIKGSPGCCNIPKDLKKAELCPKCGEIKGTDVCCIAQDKTVCPKCGKFKKSPGCCLETKK